MSELRVNEINGDERKKRILPEVNYNSFNNFYNRLKSGDPIIGNCLNGLGANATNVSDTNAFSG